MFEGNHIGNPSFFRSLFFFSEITTIFAIGREEIPIKSPEVAVDFLITHDLFNAINRRLMAFHMQPQSFGAMKTLDFLQAIVNYRREMSSSARCFAPADARSIKNNNALSSFRQQVGGGQPGDTAANDAYV